MALPLREPESWEGKRVGHYEVLERIGRGANGDVYKAISQHEDVRHRVVAIKVLKRFASVRLEDRFKLEQQLLAELRHPYLVRLLEPGKTEEGVHYTVLEYIDGKPISSYCTAKRLGLTERIELFVRVLEAFQSLHVKAVHRDVKPEHILVGDDSLPRIIDLGMACWLSERVECAFPNTPGGREPYAPMYESPEQLNGEPAGVRSDIYSLGLILFQLLTLPQGAPRVHRQGAPRASQRIAGDPEQCGLGSRRRLAIQLRGGLDAILMKALQPRPEDRYASAEAFAADLRAFLRSGRISARDPKSRYRLESSLRKNGRWAGVLLALVLLAGTSAGLGFRYWSAARRSDALAQALQLAASHLNVEMQRGAPLSALAVATDRVQMARIFDELAAREREGGVLLRIELQLLESAAQEFEHAGDHRRAGEVREQIGVVKHKAGTARGGSEVVLAPPLRGSAATARSYAVLGTILEMSGDPGAHVAYRTCRAVAAGLPREERSIANPSDPLIHCLDATPGPH